MAFAPKYIFRFGSTNGVDSRIQIELDGYAGDPIYRSLGKEPVLKKQKNGPICGTSLEFYAECKVDGEFAELYTSDPKAYRVCLYRSDSLVWTGFLSTELYSEPLVAPPYDVQVIATDGLGELKLVTYTAVGSKSLENHLVTLLDVTGSSRPIIMASMLTAQDASLERMLDLTIDLDYMEGETYYELLKYFMDSLHATITAYGDSWLIVREVDLASRMSGNDLSIVRISTSGTRVRTTISDVMVTAGQLGVADMWPVGHMSTGVEPARNQVSVEAPWYMQGHLDDAEMTESSSSDWNTDGSVSFHSPRGYYIGYDNTEGALHQSIRMSYIAHSVKLTVHAMASNTSGRGRNGTLKLYAAYTYDDTVLTGAASGWRDDDTSHVEAIDLGKVTIGGSDSQTQTYEIEIPVLEDSHAGALTIYLVGKNAFVSYAMMEVSGNRGYKDIIKLDNGARGAGEEVEIMGGRITSDGLCNKSFYQGVWMYNGSPVTSFQDSNFSNADFLSITALSKALSVALPRLKTEGRLNVPSTMVVPPLLISVRSTPAWIETFEFDLLNDELKVSALSLPAASISVQSEQITELDENTGTYGSRSSSSSSSTNVSSTLASMVGAQYFEEYTYTVEETDPDTQETVENTYTSIKLKDEYTGLWAYGFGTFGLNPHTGESSGATTLLNVWRSLTNNSSLESYDSTTLISPSHLPVASASAIGGVMVAEGSGLAIDANGCLSVTSQGTTYTQGDGINISDANVISVVAATSAAYGGIKVGFTTTDRNYAVLLDANGAAYVNVPWTGATYTEGTGISISGTTIALDSTYQTYISRGNTAYGWGDHSQAGYATSADLGGYLPLTGGSVTGDTTFSTRIAVGSSTAQSNYPLYVSGQSLLDGNTYIRGAFAVGTSSSNKASTLYGTLTVTGLGTFEGDIRLKDSTNYGRAIYFGDGSYVYLKEVSDDALTIHANNGITLSGAVSASSTLSVTGKTSMAGDLYLKNSTDYGSKIVFGNYTSSTDYVYLKEDTDDHLTIYGRKGITLGVSSTSYKVLVDGIAQVSGKLYLGGTTAYMEYNSSNSGIYLNTGIYSYSYGTFGANASSSDIRLKEDIREVSARRAIDVLGNLRPVEWVWNAKARAMRGQQGAGIIAQETEGVLPFAVVPAGEYLAINYNVLHAYEIAALNSHEGRIRKLERENRELKKQLAEYVAHR